MSIHFGSIWHCLRQSAGKSGTENDKLCNLSPLSSVWQRKLPAEHAREKKTHADGMASNTPNAWHGAHEMDGMHVLIGSVPGMRRPLTGCPCFYPWLHVTVLNSTGKCTQPPCVFERHSLLHPTATLPFSSPELSAVCKNPERKASGHETRLGGRMVGGQTRTRRCHVRLRSVHNVYVPFGKAVPGDGRRNAGPEVGLKKRPPGPGTQALRGRAKTAGQG